MFANDLAETERRRHHPRNQRLKTNRLRRPADASAAFIFVCELSRKIIGKGSYLERRATAPRVDSAQFDPIELIFGKDRDDLACLELGPAHPSRGDGYSEPCFGAGNDAVGRGDLDRPFHGYGRCFPRSRETPAGPAGETRAENAVVPSQIGWRLRRSLARRVTRRQRRGAKPYLITARRIPNRAEDLTARPYRPLRRSDPRSDRTSAARCLDSDAAPRSQAGTE
jgi:hypothetical protein